MDIDNLKSTWQALQTQPEPILKNEQIRKLLKGKANDSISKIKRSILIEGGLAIFVSVLFIVNNDWFHSPFIIPYLIAVMLLCLVWYAFMYYKIRKADLEENLKQTLQKLISTLDLYLNVYLYGSLALGLFAAMLPLFWKNVDVSDLSPIKSIIIGVAVFVAIPAYYLLIKWYIKKLYGNYVIELKEELTELEDLN